MTKILLTLEDRRYKKDIIKAHLINSLQSKIISK